MLTNDSLNVPGILIQHKINMKYRKKPIVIDAIQYTGDNKHEIINFTEGQALTNTGYSYLTIPTLEGNNKADVGDWIIKGIKGEFYPCKPDIFTLTYEQFKTACKSIDEENEKKCKASREKNTLKYYSDDEDCWYYYIKIIEVKDEP